MPSGYVLTPLRDDAAEGLRRKVIDYWNALAQSDDLGVALGERAREMEIRVTELLQTGQVCDVYEANRITAKFHFELLS